MKQVKIKLPLRALTLASGLLLTVSSFAQTNAVKGHVKDASGEPIMGATITVNGKAVGITDMDGNFSVDAAPGANLTFTYLGMTPKTIKATSNFFKQKTAYEISTRDWSSDVCSSDLQKHPSHVP